MYHLALTKIRPKKITRLKVEQDLEPSNIILFNPILNKTINAVTKVYAANGFDKDILFSKEFVVKRFGTEQLVTTIKDNKIPQLTAVVTNYKHFQTRLRLN